VISMSMLELAATRSAYSISEGGRSHPWGKGMHCEVL